MLSDMTLGAVLKRIDAPVIVHGSHGAFRDNEFLTQTMRDRLRASRVPNEYD